MQTKTQNNFEVYTDLLISFNKFSGKRKVTVYKKVEHNIESCYAYMQSNDKSALYFYEKTGNGKYSEASRVPVDVLTHILNNLK